MSVIAKLNVLSVAAFGTGSFVELGCVAENETMAAYATSNEDKLFSRYSPWGEIRLHQRSGWSVFGLEQQHVPKPGAPDAFYAIMIPVAEVEGEAFEGAAAFVKINCYETAKRAGDGTHVELREVYQWTKESKTDDWRDRRGVIEKLSWKMSVDNPPAEAQFVAGKDYWLVFYDAAAFTMQEALAAAHGHVEAA